MSYRLPPQFVGCPLAGNVARKRATYNIWRRDHQSRGNGVAMLEARGTNGPASTNSEEATA